MRRTPPALLVLLLAAAVLPPSATAQKPDKPKGKPKTVEPAPAGPTITLTFTTEERRILTDYYRQHPAGVKPLPPGIAKNLARGKPLPPGIAKQQLPQAVLTLLPPRPGYERTIVGDL
ncbi:MAG TPA: hypothetical protein VLD58_06840, partial [Gemmatimonadales bacterium]|nr:hypothetical protein [Gemmatimonadales bacterium]